MKAFMGFLMVMLCFIALPASADYRVQVRDVLAEENTVFESCQIGFYAFTPGVGEGSYLYVTCDDEAQPGLTWTPGVWSQPFAEIEEVGISFPPYGSGSGYIERLDCYQIVFVHESPGESGRIELECGDMHIGSTYSADTFKSGFEHKDGRR